LRRNLPRPAVKCHLCGQPAQNIAEYI